MKDQPNSNHEKLLEQATRALRETLVPDEPFGDALAQTVATIQFEEDQHHPPNLLQRSRTMKPFAKIATVAASLLILGGVLTWLTTAGGGAGVALADVAEVLQRIRSATFTGTHTTEGEDPITGKAMYLEPSHYRSESSRGFVMIFDISTSRAITLVPERKFAVVLDMADIPEDTVKNWLEEVRLQIDAALAGSAGDIEELGDRQVDGRDAVGFRLRIENKDMTVWADPATALPIRIESTSGIMEPKYHHVMSDFQFNVDLDESLFSVEPPEGYMVQEVSVDASKPREQDFVDLLRAYAAEQEDDLFPPTLNSSELEHGVSLKSEDRINEKFGDWRADAELRKKVMKSEEFKAYMDLKMKWGRGSAFLQEGLLPDADWHYAGKDVKVGTLDRPIFWYRPEGSQNYRVIYADLTTQEVAADQLEGFPEAVGKE